MDVCAFDFELPRDLIAQRPARPRDRARLLQIDASGFRDRVVTELPRLLNPGDLLVVNNTRVVPARLTGRRGDAAVEITFSRFTQDGEDVGWRAFARPAKRLRVGDTITFANDLSAIVLDRLGAGEVLLRFSRHGLSAPNGGQTLDLPGVIAALEQQGAIPLPPYIRGGTADGSDGQDYQTVFATRAGAVAAPTAALHFTPSLLTQLAERGIETIQLTLHVGAGTFLPVKAERTEEHEMHAEWGEISAEAAAAIQRTRRAGGRVVAVGTTSLRLLESAAHEDGTVEPFQGETDIFITPGYRFRVVDLLLTNFHLPRSTLFMLVSAFSGLERMRAAYAHAVAQNYRFYSYGDACLLTRIEA